MEDQGKRLLLAVALVFGLMLLWNQLFPPEKGREESPKELLQEESKDAQQGKTKGADSGEGARKPGAGKKKARGKEELFAFEYPEFRAVFSSYGGSLKEWSLSGEKYYDQESEKPINLVRTDIAENEPFHTYFVDSALLAREKSEWRGEKKGEHEMVFTWESTELVVKKTFKLIPSYYLMETVVDIKNRGQRELKESLALVISSLQDPQVDEEGGWGRLPQTWNASCYVNDEVQASTVKELLQQDREWVGQIGWLGFVHPYFITAVAPTLEKADNQRLRCLGEAEGDAGNMTYTLVFPSRTLAPNEPAYRWSVMAYLGPKYLEKLDYVDQVMGVESHLREAVDLGFLAVLVRPLLWLLKKFQGFVGNWGLAIIFLTLVVKSVLLPWTHKSMKSMKRMSQLAPRMKELQERYKSDKQVQQQKIMELYRSEGVNPLSGCLPMLLQMPVWFALYRMLTVAAELYQVPFIPGWIDDLVSPDPYYVMPVLLTVTMFFQSRLTASAATGAQQKILMYGMPLMFGGFSFVFPSGLTLYIFTNTVLTGVHHLLIHNGEKKKEETNASSAKPLTEGARPPVESSVSQPSVTTPLSSAGEGGKKPGGGHKKRSGKKAKRGKKRRS